MLSDSRTQWLNTRLKTNPSDLAFSYINCTALNCLIEDKSYLGKMKASSLKSVNVMCDCLVMWTTDIVTTNISLEHHPQNHSSTQPPLIRALTTQLSRRLMDFGAKGLYIQRLCKVYCSPLSLLECLQLCAGQSASWYIYKHDLTVI